MPDDDVNARLDALERRMRTLEGMVRPTLELEIDSEVLGQLEGLPGVLRSFEDGSCLSPISKPLRAGTGMPVPPDLRVVITPKQQR